MNIAQIWIAMLLIAFSTVKAKPAEVAIQIQVDTGSVAENPLNPKDSKCVCHNGLPCRDVPAEECRGPDAKDSKCVCHNGLPCQDVPAEECRGPDTKDSKCVCVDGRPCRDVPAQECRGPPIS